MQESVLQTLGRLVPPFLRRSRRPELNHHKQLLQLINSQRYLPAYGLWAQLGQPDRDRLRRMACVWRNDLSPDTVILRFGRWLAEKGYVVQEQNGYFWCPSTLRHSSQPSLIQRAMPEQAQA